MVKKTSLEVVSSVMTLVAARALFVLAGAFQALGRSASYGAHRELLLTLPERRYRDRSVPEAGISQRTARD